MRGDLALRPLDGDEFKARVADIAALCEGPLGWEPDDPNAEFLLWKHHQNPFGRSEVWVAEAGGDLVGVRMMMRWRLRAPDGSSWEVARAVDTATAPSHQGQGVFSALTRAALDRLVAQGVAAVFNTPNDKSGPGYLKMGWQVLGPVPLAVRPRTPRGASRRAARSAGGRWGLASAEDRPPHEVLTRHGDIAALLARLPRRPGFSTDLGPDYLSWRYGFAPLGYRVALVGEEVQDGAVVYRLRRRADRVELALCEVLVPPRARPAAIRALHRAARRNGVDVLVAAAGWDSVALGLAPVPRSGPTLYWRALAEAAAPARKQLRLSLGTLELF